MIDTSKKLATLATLERKRSAGEDPCTTAFFQYSVTSDLAATAYLSGDSSELQKWALEAIDSVDFYLFGNWREVQRTDEGVIDPDWFFSNGTNWVRPFLAGISWASVLGQWDRVDKLMEFPSNDISPDPGGPGAARFCVGLADWWRSQDSVDWLAVSKEIRGRDKKDFALRCKVFDAVDKMDVKVTATTFGKYFDYWFTNVKLCPEVLADALVFPLHLAKREGLEIDLAENLLVQIPHL